MFVERKKVLFQVNVGSTTINTFDENLLAFYFPLFQPSIISSSLSFYFFIFSFIDSLFFLCMPFLLARAGRSYDIITYVYYGNQCSASKYVQFALYLIKPGDFKHHQSRLLHWSGSR